MSASNCNIENSKNLCYMIDSLSTCQSCYNSGDSTMCDGYLMVQCQMPDSESATSFEGDLPWLVMHSQNRDVLVGKNVTFASNREFTVSNIEYDPGEYISNFTFGAADSATSLNWTWTDPYTSEFMYFSYPNVSMMQEPFAYPTIHPTYSSNDDGNDDVGSLCSSSACPTNCPNGYTKGWQNGDCTVYCKSQPTNGQCMPGGSGCTSSCRDISIGAIVGIVIGVIAFFVLVGFGVYWYRCRATTPMTQRENEGAQPAGL